MENKLELSIRYLTDEQNAEKAALPHTVYVHKKTVIPCSKTAVVISDMWDRHWCKGATKRVQELAKPINELISNLRQQGVTIIHCPSDTGGYYKDHKAYRRAAEFEKTQWSRNPQWLDLMENGMIPNEKEVADPARIECDCGRQKCKKETVWKRQIDTIKIDEEADFICMDDQNIFNILSEKNLRYVLLCGVHTNMCILNRNFGIKELLRQGKKPILIRDLTDGMLPREEKPYKDHFSALDDIVRYIERYLCPTVIGSEITILNDEGNSIDTAQEKEFHFSEDRRICQKTGEWSRLTSCIFPFDSREAYLQKNCGLPFKICVLVDERGFFSGLKTIYYANEEIIDFTPKAECGTWMEMDIPFGEYIVKIEGKRACKRVNTMEWVLTELIIVTNAGTKRSVTASRDTETKDFQIEAALNHGMTAFFGQYWEPDPIHKEDDVHVLHSVGFHTQQIFPLEITINGTSKEKNVMEIEDAEGEKYKVVLHDRKYYWQKQSSRRILVYPRIDCHDKDGNDMFVRIAGGKFLFYNKADLKVGEDTKLECKSWDGRLQHIERKLYK